MPHFRPLRGIGQAREHRLAAAFLRPPWKRGLQTGAAGRVGILAGGDVEAARLRLLDQAANVRHVAPIGLRPDLQVVDHDRQSGLLANLNRLGDGLLHAKAFAADMRDVDAAVFRGDLRQLDQLLGRGVGRRRVDQRRGEAERPLLHGALEDGLLLLELLGARPAIRHSHHLLAQHRHRRE